ncbi:MAG: YicC family protein [Bacteroidales bacterium]|nr:YicC family protein [Bacteroidales bacterium]
MTGFAKRQREIDGRIITVEIKSLNSKQMDATLKLPATLREHELELRAMVNSLERGKIDFCISEETGGSARRLDAAAAAVRINDIRSFAAAQEMKITDNELLTIVMVQQDLWAESSENKEHEASWDELKELVAATIDELDGSRSHEGGILKEDFTKHVDLMEHYLGEIPRYEQERIATAKERIRNYLAEAAVKNVDENRFEQELIYYLEKLDITEEKVRLAKHINYFRDVMEHEESCGKKLGFIAQEMGREINTTGSKANHVEIQRLVVAMKDELEKIKEQLGNIL